MKEASKVSVDSRWKYLVLTVKASWTGGVPDERLQTELDNQGARGWELVSVMKDAMGRTQLIFKRPM